MPEHHVRLYMRPGCQACARALKILDKMKQEFDFWVESINIDEDPGLQAKYHYDIPMLTMDGGTRTGAHDEEHLRKFFRKATQPAQTS